MLTIVYANQKTRWFLPLINNEDPLYHVYKAMVV